VKNAKNSDDARALATDDTSGEYIYVYIYRVRGSTRGHDNSQTPQTKLRNNTKLDKLGIFYTNADGLINKKCELKVLINCLP